MITRTVRRLYIYLAAFIGLQMLAAGVSELGSALVEGWLGGPAIGAAGVAAARLGGAAALVVVGGALWAAHWALAQRDAREREGQRAVLRRLYAYAVLLVAALTGLLSLQTALAQALAEPGQAQPGLGLIRPLLTAAVSGAIWLAHWRIFGADRDRVEQAGPPATLRRWYLALALWASLGMASFGAGVLIHGLLQRFIFGAAGAPRQLAEPAAALICGLALWLPHEVWSRRLIQQPGPLQADELGAALRYVYAALVIASSLVAALAGLTALLAAAMRAALGDATWAGAFAEETRAVAAVAVALPLLGYSRARLAVTAERSGARGRVALARQLLSYLVGAISLVALYAGLSGLLGTLLRLWLGPALLGAGWRTALSWSSALVMVALPVYAAVTWRSEARARRDAEEERALARRIYLYAGLLFGVIATVAAATQLIQQIVVAAAGQASLGVAGELGRLIGVTALGAAIAAAYGALLRRAGAARGTLGAGRTIAVVADAPLREELTAALARELPGATIVACGEGGAPLRRAALASADLLILSLAALRDQQLDAFAGPRLLLAAPLEGFTLVGARRSEPALAREAARRARGLCADGPAPQRPATGDLAYGPP